MSDSHQAYTWPELVRYWKSHNAVRGKFSPDRDPDGLNNVCHSGAPLMVNRYYSRGQRRVFESLLRRVPKAQGDRALDVGCGAGRWSRLLASRGYTVTGVDLQDDLIAMNAARNPAIRFVCGEIQHFHDDTPFALASSVTVLQHLPSEQQEAAVERLSQLLRKDGHAVVLENVRDSGPHVFSRSTEGWLKLFSTYGFRAVASIPYDYSPALRLYGQAARRFRSGSRPEPGDLPAPERFAAPTVESTRSTITTRFLSASLRAACAADSLLDPPLQYLHAPLRPVHMGILFKRT